MTNLPVRRLGSLRPSDVPQNVMCQQLDLADAKLSSIPGTLHTHLKCFVGGQVTCSTKIFWNEVDLILLSLVILLHLLVDSMLPNVSL